MALCAAVVLVFGGACPPAVAQRAQLRIRPARDAIRTAGDAIRPARDAIRPARDAISLPSPGQFANPVTAIGQGVTGVASTAAASLALGTIGTWVSGGATFALHETANVLGETTTPRLDSTWFSATYWRVAEIAFVLTLPFLFAASVQAVVRSDLALLVRAALGYLPLAMLAVAIAAPLTTLLLSVSDAMASAVSSAAGHQGVDFLDGTVGPLGVVGVISSSPFLVFLVGLLTVGGALVLWIELLMREAAVYVIVLMLPLVFAAFVWPARRVWAIRAVELLVALILSKFAIVAVLSLGGAALGHTGDSGLGGMLAGVVLLILGAFAPWALLRLIPLAEVASGAAGALRGHAFGPLQHADTRATQALDTWSSLTTHMRRAADSTATHVRRDPPAAPPEPLHSPSPEETPVAAGEEPGPAVTARPAAGGPTAAPAPNETARPAAGGPTAAPAPAPAPNKTAEPPPTWRYDDETALDVAVPNLNGEFGGDPEA